MSFDAERNARDQSDTFGAVALACQRERNVVVAKPSGVAFERSARHRVREALLLREVSSDSSVDRSDWEATCAKRPV
jgi:hypothetical protein